MSEWHIRWQDEFPMEWREFYQRASDGEVHIADVMTPKGRALEFQHSRIDPDERRSREAFYDHLVWVVDGKRRDGDEASFRRVIEAGQPIVQGSPGVKIRFGKDPLLRDWTPSAADVVFDFGDDPLWMLLRVSDDVWAYLVPITRSAFVALHRGEFNGDLYRFVKVWKVILEAFTAPVRRQLRIIIPRPRPPRRPRL